MKKYRGLIICIIVFVIMIICAFLTFKKFNSRTIRGEIELILDEQLLLNLDSSSKFLTTEQALLYCTDTSKYRVGDKLFVYCEPYVAESYPPHISGKWVFRYYKAKQ